MNFPYGLSAEQVIESLRPALTPERLQRIDAVVAKRSSYVDVVFENLYDRGNVSAVMRSQEGHGFLNSHLITLDKFKESQRTTAGADKWLEITKWTSTKECFESLKKSGRKIFVTALDEKAIRPQEIPLDQPFALVMGNEKSGASQEALSLADEKVYIPMQGFVQSYNISVAAAICLNALRCRLEQENPKGFLVDEKTKLELTASYYIRTLDSAESILKQRAQ